MKEIEYKFAASYISFFRKNETRELPCSSARNCRNKYHYPIVEYNYIENNITSSLSNNIVIPLRYRSYSVSYCLLSYSILILIVITTP